MILQTSTAEYALQVICTAIAFFTLIKLLSSNVYLNYHRLLPIIAAVVTVGDFYLAIVPFMNDESQVQMLYLLVEMCTKVTLFLMLFYLCFLRRPPFTLPIVTCGVVIMIGLCLRDFLRYRQRGPHDLQSNILALILVVIVSIFVWLSTQSRSYNHDIQDRISIQMMVVSFVVGLLGYLLQTIFDSSYTFMAVALAIDCVIYYYMAQTNQIEDTAALLSGTMFDLIEYPVCLVNSHFYILDVNEAARVTFPEGRGLEPCFKDGDYKKKFLLGQRAVEGNENDIEISAGDEWYRLHWTQIDSAKGVKGYIFSVSNVSEQHQEIQAVKEETAVKSQFLAQMSHELRSPLHAIIGVSDILLAKHDISTKNRGLVQHIKKASDGLLDLVDAILDFSKLEAGKFTLTEKKYNIEDMLEELTYNTIVNLQSKPVDFSFAVLDEYPKYLYGDPMRTREIFQNILSNAVKFTDSGSIRAEVRFEREGEERVHVMFSVRDSGPGMTEDQLRDVFKEYVSEGDGEEFEGTGLGLSITKAIITLMDGDIVAESDGISGSTFRGDFYQKLGDSQMLKETVFNRRSVMQQTNSYANGTLRPEWIYPQAKILVADDMKINLEIMQQLLTPWKCIVKCVPDGASAIEACRRDQYQLILLDQMMAPVSGLEAAAEIKKLTDAPILLVTANTEDNVNEIIEEYGLAGYVGKPVHLPAINQALDTFIPPEFRQKDFTEAKPSARRDLRGMLVYQKTLETFVREMQPMLLHLPSYARDNKDLFKIKVHGIKGVSRQIGRETFADQAEIMEMAAKSDHWTYVDKHLDEFLNGLCDVVEDVTTELTEMAPDLDNTLREMEDEQGQEVAQTADIRQLFENLLAAFDSFDIARIEAGISALEGLELDKDQSKVYSRIIDAYDELEYEQGSAVLTEYLGQ